MQTHNPFLARFDSSASLVATEMQGVFESCLHQASAVQARLDADASAPMMIDDFWFDQNDWRAQLRPYVVKDGVLQIPVKGVLLHDFPYASFSWATGYVYIWKAYERGMSDPNVRGIALVIDSPGGEVAGNFDLVDKMFALKGDKPIRAYAAESAYSAAYSIASVADTITVSRTGGVGSIGVVTAHVDLSKMLDGIGYKITFIHAGKHKVDGNPYEPLPPEVKDRIQARIDELYGVFVSTVARNRGMDEQAIRDTEALTFTASQAVSNGLADDIGSLEDAVAAFAADLNTDEEDETMSGEKQVVDQAAHETAVANARTEGKNEGMKAGAAAERERISAILTCPNATGREAAAIEMALDEETSFTASTADKMLGRLPTASKDDATNGDNRFEQSMEQQEHNPNLGATDTGDRDKMSRAERAVGDYKGPKKKA